MGTRELILYNRSDRTRLTPDHDHGELSHGSLARDRSLGLRDVAHLWSCRAWPTQARAHFLFIRIGPQAEAGRSAEVFFSEQAEAGDPKFVAKIAHTRLWIQTRPGEFRELTVRQAADRLVASLPSGRSLAVVGRCEYGVLARPNQTPFLLRYYPKAVAGNPDELNRLTPSREIPFEIQPTFETDSRPRKRSADGRDSPGCASRRQTDPRTRPSPPSIPTLSEQTIKAGPDGIALWSPPPRAATRSIRARRSSSPAHSGTRNTMRSASSPRSP